MKRAGKSFLGKTIFITGSSRGLGNTFARVFAAEGATVILHGRDKDRLEQARLSMDRQGYDVHAVSFDVTDQEAVRQGIDHIEENIAPIDVLMNNAGINIRDHFLTMSREHWEAVLKTNLDSVFYVGQAVAAYMARRKSGKIINTCSLLSELARPGIPAYTVSKGGVKMLTKAMAIDLAAFNIQVNGIGPGYFATEMNQPLKANEEFDTWLKQRTPMQRWGDEVELCSAVLFLAGEGSNFMTGQIVYIDGGILASL
ncbi:SDR family oxidoreductase [Sediminispirochaeta smaragdinae]|uniref:Short-chain dehydrogenase/reductase SDR n=1 Tax=Sediminispirochaeta smaragdinae (strain DSM 11293 / JCM 15392 / SEBR 4228) TaxID=573413 RepID=E1RCH6_SEDSS|nr:SDR family oxidoreductase [Sediminispirochaeta smaragdinae]ADK80056.1 short-chain dehydrogenase/reductase SDR [Sediminispirochaeta smaragdinae DSM 11293]